METLVGIIAVAAGLGLLALVCRGLLFFSTSITWLGLVLVAGWVAANIAGMITLERLGQDHPLLAVVQRAWSGLFFYTSLLQGVVFTVAIFWTSAVLFRPGVTAPTSRVEFVTDFVKGSSAIAALLFVGVLLSVLDVLGLGGRLVAGLYALVVVALAIVPWLPAVALEKRTAERPAAVFWLTLAVYGVLSAWGMALYDTGMQAVPTAPVSGGALSVGGRSSGPRTPLGAPPTPPVARAPAERGRKSAARSRRRH